MNFLGMGPKTDYLIWRESNGFFTALSRKGNLTTWSIATGHILYSISVDSHLKEICKNFVLFSANKTDYSHLMGFNQHNNYSISLVRERLYKNKQVAHGYDDNADKGQMKIKEAVGKKYHEKLKRQQTFKTQEQTLLEEKNQKIFKA